MSVRKRADGRWIVDVVVKVAGARQRVRESAKTRDAGLRLEREIRARLDRGERVASKAPLFDDFVRDFLDVGIATNKPSERDAKKRIVERHLSPQFRGLRLDQISAEMIERFVAVQLGQAAAKTVSNRVAVLRRIMTKAAEWGRIRSVPTFPEVTIAKREMGFFTTEQAADIVNGAAAEWRTMILVALRTGMRRGELIALRWSDVDLPHARIVVSRSVWRGVEGTTKGGRSRVIDISPEARAALMAMPTRPTRGYVFGDGATPLTPGKLKWPLYSACRRAGVQRSGWHKLRHSFGSHLALAGVPLRAIQELMGHSKIETTMRYAHLLPGSKGAAVALLDTPASDPRRSGRDPIGARNVVG